MGALVMDPGSEARLVSVAPRPADIMRRLAEASDLAGEPLRVMAGFRVWSVQAAL
jgi:uncharacterized membrane protein